MVLAIIMILLMTLPAFAENQKTVIFEMQDPQGDSNGPGTYTYATSEEFGDKVEQMLDLTNFKVTDLGQKIEFRLTFALEPNHVTPWEGNGFNFHRVDIYLVTGEGKGRTDTFNKGAMVQFDTPWDKVIKIADWNQGKIFHSESDVANASQGISQGENFTIMVENKDIVVTIAKNLIGLIDNKTQYYVLVGHHDGYGPDDYRPVTEQSGKYVGGGGADEEINPNVYDILAETAEEQYSQLKWKEGKLATLKPVGGTGFKIPYKLLIIVLVALLVLGSGFMLIKRRRY